MNRPEAAMAGVGNEMMAALQQLGQQNAQLRGQVARLAHNLRVVRTQQGKMAMNRLALGPSTNVPIGAGWG